MGSNEPLSQWPYLGSFLIWPVAQVRPLKAPHAFGRPFAAWAYAVFISAADPVIVVIAEASIVALVAASIADRSVAVADPAVKVTSNELE